VLPTALSVSSLPALNVALSIGAFVLAYSALLVVEMFLMVRTIRQGPGPVMHQPARLTHVITLPTPAAQPAE